MGKFYNFRSTLWLLAPALLVTQTLLAQQPRGGGGGTPGGQPGSPGNKPGNTPGNTPGNFPGNTNRNIPGRSNSPMDTPENMDLSRPVFLSGRVIFDDGTKPSTDINIQRVCSGNPHTEAHTDSKGHFSFQVGANVGVIPDASESASDDRYFGRTQTSGAPTFNRGTQGTPSRMLMGCHLQAAYPGYRSDVVDLTQRHAMDNPDIGVIVLHHLGGIQGTAISITSELAPKKAKKAYEKAMQLESKGKTEEAEKHLQEAVDEYPKYAVAWFELGRLQESSQRVDDARKSYEAAIAADSKYVNPYEGLARLAAVKGSWQEAADRSKQAVYLNPIEFPGSWFYNALANYKLKNTDAAEKSAKEVVKLDGKHVIPQVETLLAQLSADRGDLSGAAQHLQKYLELQPNGPNSDALKQQLSKIQEAIAQAKK